MEATFSQSLLPQVVQPLQAEGQSPAPQAPLGMVEAAHVSGGTGGSPTVPSGPATTSSSTLQSCLSSLQVKLVEAEFNHTFELPSGSESDFQATLVKASVQKEGAKKMEEILKRYGVAKLPKTKDAKISALFKTFKAA